MIDIKKKMQTAVWVLGKFWPELLFVLLLLDYIYVDGCHDEGGVWKYASMVCRY